jgi:hypothetical protein
MPCGRVLSISSRRRSVRHWVLSNLDEISRKCQVARDRLILKYGLPKEHFISELKRRKLAEEILDEPDVTLWETLHSMCEYEHR